MAGIGMNIGESIGKFIKRVVRPDKEFLQEIGEVIDTIVTALQEKSEEIGIKEIIKGGSFGKGTAIKGKSDIDLLVVIKDFEVKDLKRAITKRNLLTKMGKMFEEAVEEGGALCKFIKKTGYSVQFQLKTSQFDNEWHDVDILPIADLDVDSEIDEIYSEMEAKTDFDRTFYSGSLVKLQIDFVKHQSAKLKDVIRFIKYWKKMNKLDLVSYSIELIVINVWENTNLPEEQSLKQLIIAVLTELMNFRTFAISWDDNYDSDDYEQMDEPYIRDPANPFMDVIYHTNTEREFNRIETQAGQIRAFIRRL